MRPPLKLNAIDQEHLQELYDAAGIARDQLPYTPQFEELCQGFQDRTFKNAHQEQVFGALLKYTRSSGHASVELPPGTLSDEQLKQLKGLLPRHASGGKVLPYSDEFEAARKEFSKLTSTGLGEQDFWRAIARAIGAGKRRPPPRRKKVTAPADEAGGDEDVE